MNITVNQTRAFYLVANVNSTPYTAVDSGSSWYLAFIQITPGTSYRLSIISPDIRMRAATFSEEPTTTGINGLRTVCTPQNNPVEGFDFQFTAQANENVLVLYAGGVDGGATGQCIIDIAQVSSQHNYTSVSSIVNSELNNMTALVDNMAYDDNYYTIYNPPSWLKFNAITPSNLYVSGNSWIGLNTTDSTNVIKFNRRDTKMFYLYEERGTLYDSINFYKLRWKGYSQYNQTGSSYLQEWELYFFDIGDIMIRAVNIPSNNYDGIFTLTAASSYTYTKPTLQSPYVSFYSQNSDNTLFTVAYEMIQVQEPFNNRWLIKDGNTFYNIVDGALNPLSITGITAQNMLDYGNSTSPVGSLLTSLTSPKIYHWNDSDETATPIQPTIVANLTATPPTQAIEVHADMSSQSITGIRGVTAGYTGTIKVRYSLDDGITYTSDMLLADFLALNFDAIYGNLPSSKMLYLIISLYAEATLTHITFNMKNT